MDPKDKDKLKQQEAEQAVPPSPPPNFVATVREDVKKAQADESGERADKENKLLMELSEDDRWKVVVSRIRAKQQRIMDLLRTKVGSGSMELNEIGMRYTIADQVVGAYEDVINMVETAAKMQAIPDDTTAAE